MNVLYLLGYVTYFLIIMSNIAYSSSLKVQCLHVMFKKIEIYVVPCVILRTFLCGTYKDI